MSSSFFQLKRTPFGEKTPESSEDNYSTQNNSNSSFFGSSFSENIGSTTISNPRPIDLLANVQAKDEIIKENHTETEGNAFTKSFGSLVSTEKHSIFNGVVKSINKEQNKNEKTEDLNNEKKTKNAFTRSPDSIIASSNNSIFGTVYKPPQKHKVLEEKTQETQEKPETKQPAAAETKGIPLTNFHSSKDLLPGTKARQSLSRTSFSPLEKGQNKSVSTLSGTGGISLGNFRPNKVEPAKEDAKQEEKQPKQGEIKGRPALRRERRPLGKKPDVQAESVPSLTPPQAPKVSEEEKAKQEIKKVAMRAKIRSSVMMEEAKPKAQPPKVPTTLEEAEKQMDKWENYLSLEEERLDKMEKMAQKALEEKEKYEQIIEENRQKAISLMNGNTEANVAARKDLNNKFRIINERIKFITKMCQRTEYYKQCKYSEEIEELEKRFKKLEGSIPK